MGRLGNGECPGPVSAPSPRAWWTSALLSGSLEAPSPRSSRVTALTWSLAAEPGAAAIAREICTGVLGQWEMADRAADVELVVSELVTNALRHGRRGHDAVGAAEDPICVSMLRRGPELVCAVRDRSDRMPQRRDPDFQFESGRGLHLVASFCSGWGVLPVLPSGKHVWARFG
ncbi:ATP-binding protein [Streptomonospora sp. PA3]|nr:ATP-binding protein [Streptomonospora sp. PA3]MUL42559.1 ATP-binding protein [Streptomonospora sp. PA3]